MNKAQYTGWPSNNFPLSTEGLDFIQNQILLAANAVGGIAGGNYILTGCVVTGTTAASGIMVINGEVLPFTGGTVQSTIRITEVAQDITAGSVTYTGAHTVRYVEFGSNVSNANTFNWADFTAIPTLKYFFDNYATTAQLNALADLMMPKCAIIEWGGAIANIPSAYAICDGSTVNGITTPNKCGRVTIGYDPSSNSVPANVTDLTENYGKAGNMGGKGTVLLKSQESGLPAHKVPYYGSGSPSSNPGFYMHANQDGQEISVPAQDASSAHENRMPYIVGIFIMKVV
jgi:hypothetical protein